MSQIRVTKHHAVFPPSYPRELSGRVFFLVTVEGGDAVRLRIFRDEAEALEAVGLSE